MLALIYVRVSTEEQAKRGFSVPEQLLACRSRAQELGATDIVEIVDDVGGDRIERPKLEQARQLVRSRRVKWFICFDPDRFSRNLLNQLLVTDEIDRAGTDLVFIQHNREKTAEGNLFYAVRGAIAEFEKKKIVERTQRGKRGKVKQGLLPGYVDPFGYTMDTADDRLVVNEEEARWVRKIFEWASDPDPDQRIGQKRIATRLNEMGVPAPRCCYWYRSTVAGILRNPLYTGVLRWGKYDHSGVYQARRVGDKSVQPIPRPQEEILELSVPAIVSRETFVSVQHYIELDKHRRSRGRTHMLTGIALCGLCGGHVQSKTMSRRYLVCANRYPSYRDMSEARRTATKPCPLPHVQTDPVEEYVWDKVCQWIRDPNTLRTTVNGSATPSDVGRPLVDELTLLQQQISELEEAQARVLALAARANVKPEIAEQQLNQMGKQLQSLSHKKAQIQAKVSVIADQAPRVEQVLETVQGLALEVGSRLNMLSDENRTHLVRRLVARVVLSGKTPETWTVVPLGSV